MKLKDLLNENVLGSLPSSKLMKMKWNPVTEAHHEEEPVEEAAPRMKKDKDVDKLMDILKDVSRIENVIKSRDSSRYSHVKREFKKFHDALITLRTALRVKGPTIPN
jgi:hypothetical protein